MQRIEIYIQELNRLTYTLTERKTHRNIGGSLIKKVSKSVSKKKGIAQFNYSDTFLSVSD